jgi:hypothetical protein
MLSSLRFSAFSGFSNSIFNLAIYCGVTVLGLKLSSFAMKLPSSMTFFVLYHQSISFL